jgi:hypothetical protein
MIRTQIQLTEEQSRLLKATALAQGISISEIIRRSVDSYLRSEQQPNREELKRRSLLALGKFADEQGDVSENHDRYLADIYAEVGE